MNNGKLILTALVPFAVFLLGCQERPTAPLEDGRQGPQLAKGGNKGEQGPTQTVTFTFRDAGDLVFGDGRVLDDVTGGTRYTDDECGVLALLPSYNGSPALRTKDSPIKRNEVTDCGNQGREGRVFNVSFTDRVDSGDRLDWDQQTMTARGMNVSYDIRAIQKGQTEDRKLTIVFDDQGGHGGGGFGLACPWYLRFDSEYLPQHGLDDPWGTSDVQVTRLKQQSGGDDYDEWMIEAGREDVAVCLGGKEEPIVLGYYHVPFQVNVVCEGEC